MIDGPMRTIHEMVCGVIISCTVGKPEGDSVLFCEDEAMLLTLNTTSTNIWRQVVRFDGASSVLGLATTSGLFSVSGSCWLCSCSSSRKPVWESLDHLFWRDWQLWSSGQIGCFWCCVEGLIAEVINIVGCQVGLEEMKSVCNDFDVQAGVCHGSSIFE